MSAFTSEYLRNPVRRQVVGSPCTQAETVSRTSYGTVTQRTEHSRWEPETFARVGH